jgi:hypothetical protein
MKLEIQIDSDEAAKAFKEMSAATAKVFGAALDKIGDAIRTTAITKISDVSGRSGRFRFRVAGSKKNNKKAYYRYSDTPIAGAIRASAEGEYPAAAEGFLAKSVVKNQEGHLKLSVEATADYSARLEYDLKRPFMKMAALANHDYILKETGVAVDKIIRVGK